jgi:hypothetical protein
MTINGKTTKAIAMPTYRNPKTGKTTAWKSGLIKSAGRAGIRATNLQAALESLTELQAQQVAYDKPSILIESAEILNEKRSSAKDMALYEALLCNARNEGIEERYQEIRVSTLLAFVGIDSVDRLIESLVRIGTTQVYYDFRYAENRKRQRGLISLLEFHMENDLPSTLKSHLRDQIERDSAVLRYSISPYVRDLYLANKRYTWLSLAAISQFKCRYTAALYQMLAVKAGHDDVVDENGAHMRLPVQMPSEQLARKIGWRQGKGPFNAALFLDRAITPALQDIKTYVSEFEVHFEPPVRTTGRGRPLEDLVFRVRDKQLSERHPATQKRAFIPDDVRSLVATPDHTHDRAYFPSMSAFSRVCHRLREPHAYGERASKHRHANWHDLPKTLDRQWRLALDVAVRSPDDILTVDGLDGHTIQEAVAKDDQRAFWGLTGTPFLDEVFERWGASGYDLDGVREDPKPELLMPDHPILKPLAYEFANRLLNLARERTFWADPSILGSNLNTGLWKLQLLGPARAEGINLGGLDKAMNIIAYGHPVRMRQCAKTLAHSVIAHDFRRIGRLMKAILANEATINLHPKTNEKWIYRRKPRTEHEELAALQKAAYAEGY